MTKKFDWLNYRRETAAKIMAGLLSQIPGYYGDVVEYAVHKTDELIVRLQKTEEIFINKQKNKN